MTEHPLEKCKTPASCSLHVEQSAAWQAFQEQLADYFSVGTVRFDRRGQPSGRKLLAKSSQAGYRWYLERLGAWCILHGIAPEELAPRQFDQAMEERAASDKTQKQFQLALRSYLRSGGHEAAPFMEKALIEVPEPGVQRTLEMHEIDVLVGFLLQHPTHQHLRTLAMILFSLEGGLRVSEICRLTVDDVDLDNGWASVQRSKGEDRTPFPLMPMTVEVLRRYLENRPAAETAHLFLTDEAKPMSRNPWRLCIRRTVDRINELEHRAGRPPAIARFSPHALRRGSTVAKSFTAGMPDHLLQKAHGWKDASMLRRYTANHRVEIERQYSPVSRISLPVEVADATR